jgi:fructokinase
MFDIVSLGELLVDFTECGRSPSGMRLFEQNAGGAVTNLLCAAANCGAKTAYIGKVGNDMQGQFLKASLEEAGVDTQGLRMDDGVFTTLAFVALGPSGEREFSFARKPGADTCLREDELETTLLSHTRIFHIGSLSMTNEPSRSATLKAISLAKKAGALISYDPNYRASLWKNQAEAEAMMQSLIPSADFMKISDEEAYLLTGIADPVEASARLAALGVTVVAVTLGGKGALVRYGTESRFVPGFQAKVVDTTGAGDSFFGGFLFRFLSSVHTLSNLTVDAVMDMAAFGNATASLCVEKHGGIPAMPTLEQILRRMNGKDE